MMRVVQWLRRLFRIQRDNQLEELNRPAWDELLSEH
jgi:hypothetical protein